jgi:sulfide-dependent adenosine diphosphate thiazole synthase
MELEVGISQAILTAYTNKLARRLSSDVLIVGAGPSGLIAAYDLAKHGLRVTIVEKRLTPGGGIWGGAMGMNEIVLEPEILPILDEFGVRHAHGPARLFTVDSTELATALCFKALQAGAVLLNLTTVEDVCVLDGKVAGVVVNRTLLAGTLPIDPITLAGRAVVDATGHDATVIEMLRRRDMLDPIKIAVRPGEGPMDAVQAEKFVVEHVVEIFPGLWVAGMAVCTTFGGPRMGPIFGGMLLSGRRAAELLIERYVPGKDHAADEMATV